MKPTNWNVVFDDIVNNSDRISFDTAQRCAELFLPIPTQIIKNKKETPFLQQAIEPAIKMYDAAVSDPVDYNPLIDDNYAGGTRLYDRIHARAVMVCEDPFERTRYHLLAGTMGLFPEDDGISANAESIKSLSKQTGLDDAQIFFMADLLQQAVLNNLIIPPSPLSVAKLTPSFKDNAKETTEHVIPDEETCQRLKNLNLFMN